MSEVNVSVSGSSSITPTVTNGGQVSVSVVGSSTINPTVGNGDAVNVTVASVGATGPAGAAGAAGAQGPAGPAGTTSWNGITDKPATFTPSSHSHAISDVTGLQTALDGKQASGTYATLVGGTVPSTQLPSYVDDVLEFAATANFPATGESGKIYVATGTGKVYRWSGSAYVEIIGSPGSTDAVPEGAVNLYHTTARAAAAAPVQSVAGRTGAVTIAAADVSGLGSLATQSSVSYSAITDKPSTFAPSSHTHTASAITDFSSAVDAKLTTQSANVSFAGITMYDGPGSGGGMSIRYQQILGIASLSFSSGGTQTTAWTGSVAIAGVTGLQTELDGKQPSGTYATLVGGTVPTTQLPAATTSTLGGVIVGSGLSVSSGTISAAVQSVNGLTGAVVVIATYATADSFPATGQAATLYVETDTGRVYQWTGSVYAETGIDSASGQHASQHGAAGSDPITIATSQITGFNAAAAAAAPVQSVNGSTGAITVSTGKPIGLILALT